MQRDGRAHYGSNLVNCFGRGRPHVSAAPFNWRRNIPDERSDARCACLSSGEQSALPQCWLLSVHQKCQVVESAHIDRWADVIQDVVAKTDSKLLARAFISAETLAPLEGRITATLMTPQLMVCGGAHVHQPVDDSTSSNLVLQ